MMIFDTHAHYDDDAFDADRDSLLAGMPAGGVSGIVNMGASLQGARDSLALARKWPFVYAGCGIHPDHAGELDERAFEEIRSMCADPKCVAVGEIGLDYHWMVWPKELQKEVFIRQLHLAAELDLPVNVHSREASQDTFDVIREEHAGRGGGIIHCFSGSAEMAAEYVKMGYHIGIGGVVTYKNAKALRRVVESVPLEALVTETDCPYLAPSGHRGERNCSAYITAVVEQIAKIRQLPVEETAEALYRNGKSVYRLA